MCFSLLVVYLTECVLLQLAMSFPEAGLVYDYQLYDAGITLPACEDDEEEEALKANVVSL